MSQSVAEPPTRARYTLVLWLFGLAGVLYLDRVCMGQAVQPIQDDLHFTDTQMSYVMMAFTLAYGLFEVPAGWLGDRLGGRSVLTGIVIWWSVFTALTGAGNGLMMMIAIRFLFGAGEAGAFPNVARVITRWFPLGERGRVQGIMLTAAQLGSVFAPPIAAGLIDVAGWRWAFVAFGTTGIAWALGFWLWFRDDPGLHSGVNDAELSAIRGDDPHFNARPGPVPWRAVLANRGILTLSLLMVCGAFFTYLFYSWFPKYLRAAHNLSNSESGWLASLALAGSAIGVFSGGFIADRITHRSSNPVRARRCLGACCFLTAAGMMYIGARTDTAMQLAACFALATLAMHITLPNWWSVALPQCGRHVATLFGLMNGLGVFGAMGSQYFVGAFADAQAARGLTGREQWDPMFDVYVLVLIGGAVAWWCYRFTPLQEKPTDIADPRTAG